LSLDLGPVAFTFRGNVEEREGSKNKSKLLIFIRKDTESLKGMEAKLG